MKLQIRRRISKRFHMKEDQNKANCIRKKENLPPVEEVECRYTKTIEKLVLLFLDMFVSEGYRGIPVKMEELDPYDSSDDYEDRVIQAYRRKPWNYEAERRFILTDEARKVHKKQDNPTSKIELECRRVRQRKVAESVPKISTRSASKASAEAELLHTIDIAEYQKHIDEQNQKAKKKGKPAPQTVQAEPESSVGHPREEQEQHNTVEPPQRRLSKQRKAKDKAAEQSRQLQEDDEASSVSTYQHSTDVEWEASQAYISSVSSNSQH